MNLHNDLDEKLNKTILLQQNIKEYTYLKSLCGDSIICKLKILYPNIDFWYSDLNKFKYSHTNIFMECSTCYHSEIIINDKQWHIIKIFNGLKTSAVKRTDIRREYYFEHGLVIQ